MQKTDYDLVFYEPVNQIPNQLSWSGIYFNLTTAIKDTVFAEHRIDDYVVHIKFGEYGDKWKGYTVLVSIYRDEMVSIRFVKDQTLYEQMAEYCALLNLYDNKYRSPLNDRYSKHFPTLKEVYNFSREEYRRFAKLYFLDEI